MACLAKHKIYNLQSIYYHFSESKQLGHIRYTHSIKILLAATANTMSMIHGEIRDLATPRKIFYRFVNIMVH